MSKSLNDLLSELSAPRYLYPNMEIEKRMIQAAEEQSAAMRRRIREYEELQEKRHRELISAVKRPQKGELLPAFLMAVSQLQGLAKAIEKSENSRNSFVAFVINREGFIAKDQSLWGHSETGLNAGEVDIKIENDEGDTLSLCECLVLPHYDSGKIESHLTKLFGYDVNGLEQNFILVYSEDKKFFELWEKYCRFVKSIAFQHPLQGFLEITRDVCREYKEIFVGRADHQRNQKNVTVYHIFVNMAI